MKKIIFFLLVFFLPCIINAKVQGTGFFGESPFTDSGINYNKGFYAKAMTSNANYDSFYYVFKTPYTISNANDYTDSFTFNAFFYNIVNGGDSLNLNGFSCQENGGCWGYQGSLNVKYNTEASVSIRYRGSNNSEYNCTTTNGGNGMFHVTCPYAKTNIVRIEFFFGFLINLPSPLQFGFSDVYNISSSDTSQASQAQIDAMNKNQQQANQNSQNEVNATNKNTEAVNNMNSTISNSNVDVDGSFFSGFDNETHGLTSIITAPLQLIGSITSSTCSPLGLPIPFVNQTAYLPCMGDIYIAYFGSFFTLYQTITFGIVSYWVCVQLMAMVKGFKDPDSDKVEVLDL